MTESEIQNAIFLAYGREPDVTLWRNNVGVAQHAAVTKAHLFRLLSMIEEEGRIHDACDLIRSLIDEQPTFTRYGLCVGSSDIIGIVHREIYNDSPPYDARFDGVFLAIEVKVPGKKPTKEQRQFLDLVNARGGVGRCVHSVEEAGAAIQEARNK